MGDAAKLEDIKIPENILAVANSIVSDIPSRVNSDSRPFIANVIARAIMAENTACLDSHEALQKQNAELVEALGSAKTHIENGVEFGFINMPSDPYDPAHKTLPMINAALAKAKAPS